MMSCFHMWEMVFVEWENYNILDKIRDVPTCLLAPIEKSTFGYFSNLKEKQLKKLAQGFFTKTITIYDRPMKGRGQPDLKSMYKFTKQLKRKAIIRNEIMIHFGFPKLTANNQKPYSNETWKEKKLKKKLDKMFFLILDFELNEEFYTKKMRLNPFDKAPPIGFKTTLKRWIKSIVPEGIAVDSILLDTHYMYDKVNDMVELLDVLDKMN